MATRTLRPPAAISPMSIEQAAQLVDPVRAQERSDMHERAEDGETVIRWCFTVHRRDGLRAAGVLVAGEDRESARIAARALGRDKLIADARGIDDDER